MLNTEIDLTAKTAIVTGASRGIGKAAALRLAAAGANVALLARSTREIEATAAEIGPRAMARACDVSDGASVAEAAAAVTARWGGTDILVNNAGLIEPIARIEDTDPAAWHQVIAVNLMGPLYAIRAVLPGMKARGGGVIINISSGAATNAMEGWSHYCASKAGLLMLTQCVHKEEAESGVRCVGLSPGTVATDMQVAIKQTGINPVAQLDWSAHIPPDWVGEAIAWMTTDAARSYDGGDIKLRLPEVRQAIGLPQ